MNCECPTCHFVACICPEDHEQVILREESGHYIKTCSFEEAMATIELHPGCYCERNMAYNTNKNVCIKKASAAEAKLIHQKFIELFGRFTDEEIEYLLESAGYLSKPEYNREILVGILLR